MLDYTIGKEDVRDVPHACSDTLDVTTRVVFLQVYVFCVIEILY